MERMDYYLDLKSNVKDGSDEIPADQMPKKTKDTNVVEKAIKEQSIEEVEQDDKESEENNE